MIQHSFPSSLGIEYGVIGLVYGIILGYGVRFLAYRRPSPVNFDPHDGLRLGFFSLLVQISFIAFVGWCTYAATGHEITVTYQWAVFWATTISYGISIGYNVRLHRSSPRTSTTLPPMTPMADD